MERDAGFIIFDFKHLWTTASQSHYIGETTDISAANISKIQQVNKKKKIMEKQHCRTGGQLNIFDVFELSVEVVWL